ncbi:MAG: manganese efflux pump MntP family protein [Bacteroides sp.]|nr:manganese efflux pump MntP family protein [Bacteroides sp.]
MTKLDILLVAIGLAMDCLAVSVASGIVLKKIQWRPILVMAFFFGFFQALMPFLGWGCASRFSHLIESFDHWIAFSILLFLGGRMILESFKEEDCKKEFNPASLKVVLTLAIATSIDALAVGISFACLDMTEIRQVLPPITAIGMVSFLMSVTGLLFGITFGCKYARRLRAELWGGVILILIGSKILAEHLLLEGL